MAGGSGAAASAGSGDGLTRRRLRAARLMLLPLLAALALVAAWPLARTVGYSVTDADLSGFVEPAFVGLENYRFLVLDPLWWRAVANTLIFTVVSVGLETLLGLVIALVLNAHLRGGGLLRAAVLVPWAVPTVVSAKMWGWMLHDLYGVVNTGLLALGLIAAPWAWLADPVLSMTAVIAVDVWKTTPFMALLILAALQVVPPEIHEAARVDGASRLRIFVEITLPLIRPALLAAVVFRGLDALRVFDVIYVLTGNTPDTASMSVYARQQLIDFQDAGLGSAAATCLVVIVAMLAAAVITLGRVHVSAQGGER